MFLLLTKSDYFLHFIEKKFQVNYRYNKIFLSKIFKNKKNKLLRYKYYVGKKILITPSRKKGNYCH